MEVSMIRKNQQFEGIDPELDGVSDDDLLQVIPKERPKRRKSLQTIESERKKAKLTTDENFTMRSINQNKGFATQECKALLLGCRWRRAPRQKWQAILGIVKLTTGPFIQMERLDQLRSNFLLHIKKIDLNPDWMFMALVPEDRDKVIDLLARCEDDTLTRLVRLKDAKPKLLESKGNYIAPVGKEKERIEE